jgi:transposase
MQLNNLDITVINHINELKANYENRIKDLQNNFETSRKELEYKYLELKERYDLLIYKRFVRTSEQLLLDNKQPLLFDLEEEKKEVAEEATESEEETEVKSYKRKKPGRKAIDPNIPRVERIIDIPETEKTCGCGTDLSKIGEESSEKLHIIPPRIYVGLPEKVISLYRIINYKQNLEIKCKEIRR